MYGVKLNERKISEELRELLGVSLMIKNSRLRWFGHVERKDDNDWVKHTAWEVAGIRQRGCPKKTWCDCVKNDMESLGLSQKDAQSRNKWRRRIKGQPANPGSAGKMAIKMECVCVWNDSFREQRCYCEVTQLFLSVSPVISSSGISLYW